MTLLRRHRQQPSSRSTLALHALVLSMLVTFLPHCLFGCSMAMEGAAMPMPALAAVMDCCATACPMDHADECLSSEEDANEPDAVLVKSDPIVPDLAPTSVTEAGADRVSTPGWTLAIETVPHAPPVPLHLLNSQFLI